MLIDAPDPRREPRICPIELQVLHENPVEGLVVLLAPDQPVFQKREGSAVGDGEVAQEVVAAGEHRLEEVSRARELRGQPGRASLVGPLLGELLREPVGRTLPDAVEPVDEDARFGAPRRVQRIEGRLGIPRIMRPSGPRGLAARSAPG